MDKPLSNQRWAFLTAVFRRPAARWDSGELIGIMARRELLRLLPSGGHFQGLSAGLAGSAVLALLIPLHRAYGGFPVVPRTYFLLLALTLQIGLAVLAGRAVWAGMRHDAASGTSEELLLTGARAPALLVGKWLGIAAAGCLWAMMTLPCLLLAAAMTGTTLPAVFAVVLCLAVSAAAGGMVGAVFSLRERSALSTGVNALLVLPAWELVRVLLPSLAVWGGSRARVLIDWVRSIDPITLIAAAVGEIPESWLLKLLVLAVGTVVAAVWVLGSDADLPYVGAGRPQKDPGDMFSLRPVRAWMTGQPFLKDEGGRRKDENRPSGTTMKDEGGRRKDENRPSGTTMKDEGGRQKDENRPSGTTMKDEGGRMKTDPREQP